MRRQRTMRAKVGAARECGAATALPLDTQGLATCARMPNVHAMPRTADIIDDRCCARHDGAGWRSSPNSWQHDQDAPPSIMNKWDDRHRKAFAVMDADPD